MAGAGLKIDDPAAARAIAAIARHAASQRRGLVSVRAEGSDVVVASPGETSLLTARLPATSGSVPEGTYAPGEGMLPETGVGGSVTLRGVRGGLQVSTGKLRATLDRVADAPVDVAWVWPAAEAAVEAVVARDALIDALPAGEGRLAFSGADKQVVLQAGREERRLPLKNRTRRRKDIGTAVAFDQLRPLVEAMPGDVAIGLADLRPLTVESGPVRGMLVRGAPMRWRAPAPADERPAAARPRRSPGKRPAENAAGAERRRRETEREAREREQELRRRTRAAQAAVAAVGRAISQVDAAADGAGQLGDERARCRLAEARAALEAAEASLRRHLDS